MSTGIEARVTTLLQSALQEGGFHHALVCTREGLLVAEAGAGQSAEQLAGLTALFDDIVLRAQRDLEMHGIDEVTMLDEQRGRLIVRPVYPSAQGGIFLVIEAPRKATWRRVTTQLSTSVGALLRGLIETSEA